MGIKKTTATRATVTRKNIVRATTVRTRAGRVTMGLVISPHRGRVIPQRQTATARQIGVWIHSQMQVLGDSCKALRARLLENGSHKGQQQRLVRWVDWMWTTAKASCIYSTERRVSGEQIASQTKKRSQRNIRLKFLQYWCWTCRLTRRGTA